MEKSSNSKKVIIVTLIIAMIIICGSVIYNLFKSNVKHNYLFLQNSMLWQQKAEKWIQLGSPPEDMLKQKYMLYDKTTKIENVKIQKENSQWYYFKDNYSQIKPTNLRGITNIEGIKFADYKKEFSSSGDTEYINSALKQININSGNGYYTSKVIYDFNSDGEKEGIYITSNYSFDLVNHKMYTVVYQVKNGEIEIIEKSQDAPYNFFEILDIDKDGKYEMILTYNVKNLPSMNSCYKMYKINNGKWENIRGC